MTARDGAVRWDAIRERLRVATERGDAATAVSPARVRALMDERARRLAKVPAVAARGTDALEVLSFALGGERYGVATRHVREVIAVSDVTPLPAMPPWVVGLTNRRGDLLPVLDLGVVLGLARAEAAPHRRIVVLGRARPEVGALTDAVHDVQTIPAGELLDPPASTPRGRAYVLGVTREALVVVDAALLLRDADLFLPESDEAGGTTRRRGDE